jgi:hypothetical protein
MAFIGLALTLEANRPRLYEQRYSRAAVAADQDKSCGEPASSFVDPAEQTKTGGGEVGQDVVLDLLIEQLSVAAIIECPDRDAEPFVLGRGRIDTCLRVVALDERGCRSAPGAAGRCGTALTARRGQGC